METNTMTQELKSERVQQELKSERGQEEARAQLRKRILRPDDSVGSALAATRDQAVERLKSERVQSRLKRMSGWKMVGGSKAIDRVRQFPDPLVAGSYLAFASLLARQAGQPLQVSLTGGTVVLALTGRSKGPNRGISEDVLDLAEQLG